MKTQIRWGMVLAVAACLASGAWAEDPSDQLVRFKTGSVSFSLLQPDGVTPMAGAELQMLSPVDAAVRASAVADRLGKAVLALDEGRYLLNVSGRTLSVLDVADDATLTTCRVVVPEAALLVAGQEEDEDEDRVVLIPWLKPVVIGGVAVLVAAGGYAVYDHNKDDDKDDDGIPPVTPVEPTRPPRTRPRPSDR